MDDLEKCRDMADYQFGAGAGEAIFSPEVEFKRSTSGRVSQVYEDGERLATLKNNGRFTLSEKAGKRLHESFDAPKMRVEFNDESVPFLKDGKNGFAKFVVRVDDDIRARDEVIVTGPGDEFITTGRAELSATEMKDFDRGLAVMVR